MDKNISFTLKVWRQKGPKDKGHFDTFQMKDIPGDTSFLEMMDILNEQIINDGKEPIVFDHDCREGVRKEGRLQDRHSPGFQRPHEGRGQHAGDFGQDPHGHRRRPL